MESIFNKKQTEQIQSNGIDLKTVENQINNFINGFSFLKLVKPAILGDGILTINEKNIKQYISSYEKDSKHYNIIKFVPASGAASRMFKDLFQFLTKMDKETTNIEIEIDIEFIKIFFSNLKNFAFYNDLKNVLKRSDKDLESLLINKQYVSILNALLTEEGLNYENLPKGLLKFHAYNGFTRTPVDEHFVEAAEYAVQVNKRARIHFTVSPEHISLFENQFKESESNLEEKFKINFDTEYSIQKISTDIIAVDLENKPFIDDNGELLFRPGGHGALLENLNDLDSDIVFIKNIDNLVPDHLRSETIKYKKIIGGVLISIKEKIFSFLFSLTDNVNKVNTKLLKEIENFISKNLCYNLPESYYEWDNINRIQYLTNVLNRPIRVCGMVKNEGEPGGGPFWVIMKDGSVSLQIAEKNQIDIHNPEQKKILDASTHFNPVDLVCYIKNFKGEKFNLLNYRDPETGFISKKSKGSRELKAQELPGLWNGSMAFWNTIFVEVPLITFNPVKTINDLLRPQHQKKETD